MINGMGNFSCFMISNLNMLIPSLSQAVHFQRQKVYTPACKPNIFWAFNKSAFNTVHFDVNMSTS